jgi:glycosyltransferase involved in cell wall biosynthesis
MDSLTIPFNIVVTGPCLNELTKLKDRLGAPAIFHNWPDNDSNILCNLLETASTFVLPSYVKNLPLVLLEAFYAGAAIIATGQTGCQAVITETASEASWAIRCYEAFMGHARRRETLPPQAWPLTE